MSGYYYPTYSPPGDAEYDFNHHPYPAAPADAQTTYPAYAAQPATSNLSQEPQSYPDTSQYYHHHQQQHHHHQQQQHHGQSYQVPQPPPPQGQYPFPVPQPQAWASSTVPTTYPYPQQDLAAFPSFSMPMNYPPNMTTAVPYGLPAEYLTPKGSSVVRTHRSTSLLSEASSIPSPTQSDVSRCPSPNASEMARWGIRNSGGTWSCAYPGCTSRSTFNRGCDLRKHYKRHTKSLFCRVDGCPQATEGGFSSKKDRARHEAKHNPSIVCEWEGCDRLFSRQDNMKDHVRRVHKRRAQ